MKILLRTLALLMLIAVVLPFVFGNRIVAGYATRAVEEATGFRVTFDDLHVGIWNPVIRLDNLTLTNPGDFPHPEALTVREAYMRYSRWSFLTDTIRLYELRLDIPRVVMVRPEQGPSNIEVLTGQTRRETPAPPPPDAGQTSRPEPSQPDKPTPEPVAKSRERGVVIDTFTIKLGEMELRQYMARRDQPMVLTLPVGLDRTFQNVTNIQEVAGVLAADLLVRSTVGMLGNMDQVLQAVTDDKGRLDPALRDQFRDLRKMFRGR